MKDRQPTQVLANGAIRYGIYSADGTLVRYEYMKREDAPTVEGTPLNKANLLSDDAAMKIWPDAAERPEDPTVSEALVGLKKGSAKIGDIKITSREIDSSAWLLCDGQSVTKNAYPELFQMLRPSAAPTDFVQQEVSGVSMNTGDLCHVNNKWISFSSTDAYGSIYMFVSEDTQAWRQYQFNATELKNANETAIDVCYSTINNAYYLIFWCSSKALLFKLSSDFTTLTYLRNVTFSYISTYNTGFRRKSWELPDGRIFFDLTACGTSESSASSTIKAFGRLVVYSPSANSAEPYNADSADYNVESNQLLYMYGRSVYAGTDPSDKSSAALVGEMPTSIVPTNTAFVPLVCAATNTIVVFYGDSESGYAYSTDKGATWHNVASTWAGHISWNYGLVFVNGVLVFYTSTYTADSDCTCSILTPPDQVYVTQGIYSDCALSEDGLAVTPPSKLSSSPPYSCVYVRDYNDAAKKLPAIIPSAQSRAYIKALEE